jgi:hypothetical protein
MRGYNDPRVSDPRAKGADFGLKDFGLKKVMAIPA